MFATMAVGDTAEPDDPPLISQIDLSVNTSIPAVEDTIDLIVFNTPDTNVSVMALLAVTGSVTLKLKYDPGWDI
jgi:hypothetical protein